MEIKCFLCKQRLCRKSTHSHSVNIEKLKLSLSKDAGRNHDELSNARSVERTGNLTMNDMA